MRWEPISRENAPWGTRLEFFHEERGDAVRLDMDTYAVEAWSAAFEEAFENEPVHMGAGGSIPFISTFSEMYPGIPILVIGTSDPTSAYHAPNESQDLADLERAVPLGGDRVPPHRRTGHQGIARSAGAAESVLPPRLVDHDCRRVGEVERAHSALIGRRRHSVTHSRALTSSGSPTDSGPNMRQSPGR